MTTMNASVASRAGKYLTFVLGREQYGVEIVKIREILGVLPITPMPQTPHYVKGVINLRGRVIPVIDTRLKFGMPERETMADTCIIVVDAGGMHVGILVDTVKDVVDIGDEQIEEPPSFDSPVETSFVSGLGKVGDQVRILLDIDQVLGGMNASGLSL